MNLLEQYIVEVHSEEPYNEGWAQEFDEDFVKVDVTTDCWGSKDRKTRIWSKQEWERIKKQGFYMG